MVGASYGDHWRSLRRITTAEIFSSMKLCMFLCIRKDEIRRLLLRLSRDSLHVRAPLQNYKYVNNNYKQLVTQFYKLKFHIPLSLHIFIFQIITKVQLFTQTRRCVYISFIPIRELEVATSYHLFFVKNKKNNANERIEPGLV